MLKLKSHPRLFVNEDTAQNLADKLQSPFQIEQASQIITDANWVVKQKPIEEGEASSYMVGTRTMGGRLQCLVSAWVLTKKAKYRNASMNYLNSFNNWNQISCEARINTPKNTVMSYCLTYGEHNAVIALMYDLYRNDLTEEERNIFYSVLDKFYLSAALNCLESAPWWANKIWSNWNGVCCGGMGLMALSFYDDLPQARKLIPFVEKSLSEYLKSYIQNGGGCHEGTGYWNYAMHYAMRYLISWENATGKKHPAFKIKEIAKSLHFPLDFTGITFGDNDGWHPAGFFFMLSERLNEPTAGLRAVNYLSKSNEKKVDTGRFRSVSSGDVLFAIDSMPSMQQIEKLHKQHQKKKEPVARVFKGLDWASIADDSAFPNLRLSVRGGSSEITGHGMMDLMSFKCMVNGEAMIEDQSGGTSVSYTKRGHEIYDRSAASKSTLFIDGLGCREDAKCDITEIVKGKGLLGIRVDGSHIYLPRWKDIFIGRLFLLVDNAYWVIVDRIADPNIAASHVLESRFHTRAEIKTQKDSVSFKKGKVRMTMSCASLQKAGMQESLSMPSKFREQTKIIRWMSIDNAHDNLHAFIMYPTAKKLTLDIEKLKGSAFQLIIKEGKKLKKKITITSKLKIK